MVDTMSVIESRCTKQFFSSWDSPSSSETLIIFDYFQKLLGVLFKSSSLEIDKHFTDILLMLDLHTHLLQNTTQSNDFLIAVGSPLSPDLISSWWKTLGMSAPISTLMSSTLISASFKLFKWLAFCNPRYFGKACWTSPLEWKMHPSLQTSYCWQCWKFLNQLHGQW